MDVKYVAKKKENHTGLKMMTEYSFLVRAVIPFNTVVFVLEHSVFAILVFLTTKGQWSTVDKIFNNSCKHGLTKNRLQSFCL